MNLAVPFLFLVSILVVFVPNASATVTSLRLRRTLDANAQGRKEQFRLKGREIAFFIFSRDVVLQQDVRESVVPVLGSLPGLIPQEGGADAGKRLPLRGSGHTILL